jgi:myo-inositol 2-dehydrogenase/D-chiro-inositol 1-dehydrogenase
MSVKFGLIGYGLFGSHHARAIDQNAQTELTAIAVKSEASRQSARAAHPQTEVVADYRSLLANPQIDVIDIVVPNYLHFEIARDALQAGKHLLLEKPMALSVRQCDELIEIAENNRRIIAINHELRLSSLWQGVKQLIDQGAIGDVRFALIELSRFPYRPGSAGWRYNIDQVGNWILEEPIHFFDLALWYLESCGRPTSIYAQANARDASHPELRDNFSAIVNFPNTAYAIVSQTLSAFEHHVTAKVSGTAGTIWAQWSAADARSDRTEFSLRYGLGANIKSVTLEKPTGELLELAEQIEAIANAIKHEAPVPCSGSDGRWSTLLCLAAQDSVDSGRIVTL